MEKTIRLTSISDAIDKDIIKGKFLNNRTIFEMIPINNIDTRGSKSTWVISVSAKDDKTGQLVPIKQEWLKYPSPKLDKDIKGIIETIIKRHTGNTQVMDPIIIDEGKNIGTAKATNIITQAMTMAYRKHTNKQKNASNKKNISDIRPFPMILKKIKATKSATLTSEDFKDGILVQPKLDGIRVVSHILSDNSVEFYSRKGFSYIGLDHITIEVLDIFSKYKEGNITDIYLDGEIYIYNTPLQELSGAIRGENNSLKEKLEYHIFDLFDTLNKDMKQIDRYNLLKKLITKEYKYIKLVPTYIVNSDKELDKIYDDYVKNKGYEGVIVRRNRGIYKYGIGNQRTDDVLKIKPFSTDEFKIIGYKDGIGRDKGAITFILETKDGHKFSAVPNKSIEERREIYKNIQKKESIFKQEYEDKMATIQYADLSIKGIPTQPKFIAVRDYE